MSTKIIAEAGCNWTSLEEAFQFIDKSKELRLFATKFQLFTRREAPHLPDVLYLNEYEANELFEYGFGIGHEVFFTPMYPEAVKTCENVGVRYYKVRYRDRNNSTIIDAVKRTGKPYFVSRCAYEDLYVFKKSEGLLQFYSKKDPERAKVLYCVPEYPADWREYPLPNAYPYLIHYGGVSDHTPETTLLERHVRTLRRWKEERYFEKHVKLEGTTPLEDKWSVSFKEIKEALL